jgi:multiple sugar transport system permease protein
MFFGSIRKYRIVVTTILTIILVFFTIGILIPFLWMFSSSLKLNRDVFTFPIKWVPNPIVWRNYITIWQEIPLLTYVLNSFKLTIIITFIQVLTSSFAAYGFAKMQFKGRDVLFLTYICTIAIPWQTYMIPQFIIIRNMGLVNTHLALILLQSFTAFGVFLIRQFYLGVPNELCEAARIDGLNEYGIYWRIMLPLSHPVLATLIIFSFVAVWNDFMGPLIYLNSKKLLTMQLGLRSFITEYSSEYNLIMAGAVVALIPVFAVFVSLQKYFVEGIATTGLKG